MDDDGRGRVREYDRAELLSHLRAVHGAVQRLPTIADLDSFNESDDPIITPHSQTYISRFGSWTRALEEAFPDAELCRELWRVANELDPPRRPYESDLESHGRFGTRAYYQRFGSWTDALEAAEFDPKYRIPRRFLVSEVWRVANDDSAEEVASQIQGATSEIRGTALGGRIEWTLSKPKLEECANYQYRTFKNRLGPSSGTKSAIVESIASSAGLLSTASDETL